MIGWVRMREAVRFSGPLKRATVSLDGERWFVSLMIDTDDVQPVMQPAAVVGVDLGVAALAALSTGETIAGPKAHKGALKRLRRRNKALARKRRGSANFRKAKARLAKLHARIASIRRAGPSRKGLDFPRLVGRDYIAAPVPRVLALMRKGTKMNKAELIADVADRADVTRTNAEKCVDAAFEAIAAAMAKGEEIAIPGFGKFATHNREARQGRNPHTGETIQIAAKRAASFKPLKALRDQLA